MAVVAAVAGPLAIGTAGLRDHRARMLEAAATHARLAAEHRDGDGTPTAACNEHLARGYARAAGWPR